MPLIAKYYEKQLKWGYAVKKEKKTFLYILDNKDIVDALTNHKRYEVKGNGNVLTTDSSITPKWQKNGLDRKDKIIVREVECEINKITLLNTNEELEFNKNGSKVEISFENVKSGEEVLIVEIC